jgi:hypothetical protein
MSEPITISVRDLTAEHIGWTVNPEATIAAITEPDTLGCRGVLIQWTDRTEWMTKSGGHVWKITPPPPPDPWEGVEQWVVITPNGWCNQYGNEVDAQRCVAMRGSGNGGRIIRVSASGAEVVE